MNGNSDMNNIYNEMHNDNVRNMVNDRNGYAEDDRMYDDVQRNMNNYMKDKECDGIKYRVQDGDTLYKISRMYNVSMGNLIEANRYMNIYDISVGDVICVPVDNDINNSGGGFSDNSEGMNGEGKWVVYIVEDGDTLDKVLGLYDMDFEEFMDVNKQNGILLKPGSIVVVPGVQRRN